MKNKKEKKVKVGENEIVIVIIGKSYVRYDMLTSITIGLYFLMIMIITIINLIITIAKIKRIE